MSSQGPTQPPITDLNKTVLIARTSGLLKTPTPSPQDPRASHRLSHVQALEDHLRPDKTQEPTPEEIAALQSRSQKQTLNLNQAHNRNMAFAAKQAQVAGFLDNIRKHITDPKLTPQNVTNAMQVLLKQFDDKAVARKMAVELAEREELPKKEVARLEKEEAAAATEADAAAAAVATAATAAEAAAASTPTVAASSDQTTPVLQSPLEIAREKATAAASATKVVQSSLKIAREIATAAASATTKAKNTAEKATDILAEEEGAFRAFVAHTQFRRAFLDAIVYELQFKRKDAELTTADLEVAEAHWKPIADGNQQRLKDVDRSGGRYAGIETRVSDWWSVIPKALTDEQMAQRNSMEPYIPEQPESIDKRKERQRQQAGYEPIRVRNRAQGVAQHKGQKASGASLSLAKHPHELPNVIRDEMERIGIKSTPKNKQALGTAIYNVISRSDHWNTIFEDKTTPGNPIPPRRVMLDDNAPLDFPSRKLHAIKALVPGLERHLKMGCKLELLVGQKSKSTDVYQKAEDNAELNSMVEQLKKLRI